MNDTIYTAIIKTSLTPLKMRKIKSYRYHPSMKAPKIKYEP